MSMELLPISLSFLIGSLAIAAAIYFGLTLPFKEKKPKNQEKKPKNQGKKPRY